MRRFVCRRTFLDEFGPVSAPICAVVNGEFMSYMSAKDTALGRKFLQFATDLTPAERDNFKLILMDAAAGFSPNGKLPSDDAEGALFRTVLGCLSQLQPHSSRIPSDGIAYYGRPSLISDALLSELIDEAQRRRLDALHEGDYHLGCGGPLADRFSVSQPLLDFVTAHAGPVSPTAIASYLYYEKAGQGLDPHVDTDVFSVNLILMLRHEYSGNTASHLVIYPPDLSPKRFLLQPGEVVLLFADSIVHAREPLADGEEVNLLTIGFQPAE